MDKINVYLDDRRAKPDGFVLARHAEECLILMRECRVGILSLDYDLGPEEPTGEDVAAALVKEGLYPEDAVYLHTSDPDGREKMRRLLEERKPAELAVYPYPYGRDRRL